MKCNFCNSSQSAAYVCPRCSAPYCSVACYKSKDHVQCSESFYKKCAEEHIKSNAPRNCEAAKMKETLNRHYRQREQDEDSEFSSRFSDIDLGDADAVMEVLTAEERQTFSNLISSNRAAEFVPLWKPWWQEKTGLVEEVKTENSPESSGNYKPQRKIPRSKIGGRKVQSEVATSAPGGANPRLPSECPENKGEPSSGHNDDVCDIVGVPHQDNPKAGRTLIIDARYKPRSKHPLQSTVVNTEQKKDVQSEKSTVEQLARQEKCALLDDEIFRVPDAESSVFRTKCANVLNLVTSFVFTARYFNGDFDELVSEAGRTFCSISSLFEQKECHEVPLAVGDVLSRSVVLENSDRISLIEDVIKISNSKAWVRRALEESAALLKSYSRCLNSDSSGEKQRIFKFRYKICFYIDWTDGSFVPFKKYSLPFLDLLRTESKLIEAPHNKEGSNGLL